MAEKKDKKGDKVQNVVDADKQKEMEQQKKKESKSKSEEKKVGKKEKRIKELEKQLEEFSDKHLRLQAEFDNFRRRTLKEKVEIIKSGGENVLIDILPVIDDFERALDSLKEVSDKDAAKQGTLLIYNKFKDFLQKSNVYEIDAFEKDFDLNLHEAVTKIAAPSKKLKGKVVDVIQKGYLLNDKVIRFAKVVIGE